MDFKTLNPMLVSLSDFSNMIWKRKSIKSVTKDIGWSPIYEQWLPILTLPMSFIRVAKMGVIDEEFTFTILGGQHNILH